MSRHSHRNARSGAWLATAARAAVVVSVSVFLGASLGACSKAPPSGDAAGTKGIEPPAANLGAAWGDKLDTLPDWTGLWFLNDGMSFPGRALTVLAPDPAGQGGGFSYGELPGTYFKGAPYKPEYQKIYDEKVRVAREQFKVFDSMGSCIIPHGMPRILGGGPGPTEFIVTPEQVIIIWDYMNEMMRIYTDGRPHPQPGTYEPSVMGHSIGHWEGQTLVVDTRNMRASAYDRSGAPHSDQVHVVTRISRKDANTMELAMTIDDPVMLDGEWKVTRTMRLTGAPGRPAPFDLEGSYCENNRNPVDEEHGQTAVLGSEQEKAGR
jgi:hypothetical protein